MRISDWSSDVCSSDLRQAEHDLDQLAEAAAGIAKGERQAGDDDHDHGDDLRHRPFDRFEDGLEWGFPGHRRTGGARRGRQSQGHDARQCASGDLLAHMRDGGDRPPQVGYRVHWLSPAERTVATGAADRSEEHTSELQSLMRISYAVFCLKKK